MGIFDGGGKIRLRPFCGLTADYYPESENPYREEKMATLNLELQAMTEEFKKGS